MGLDDAVDDIAPESSGVSSSSSDDSSSDEDYIVIGSPPYDKRFTEDHWEVIKDVVVKELGYTVNEAKNLPANKRYEVFHEAALIANEEMSPDDSEYRKPDKCAICGSTLHEDAIAEISGVKFCCDHPAAKIELYFDKHD